MKTLYDLADTILNHSTKVEKGQKVKIFGSVETIPMMKILSKKILEKGAVPYCDISDTELSSMILNGTDAEKLDVMRLYAEKNMKEFQATISLRSPENVFDGSDIDATKRNEFQKAMHKVREYKLENVNWVLLNYPNGANAQAYGMSTSKYTEFALQTCSIDYPKFSEYMNPLVKLMEQTSEVRIKDDDKTDLTFSIENIGVEKCDGERNLPDGEVLTAPVKDSINGVIQFNTVREVNGVQIKNVFVRFENGKAVEVISETNNEEFNTMLDIDDGARHIGEFAFGLNPYITKTTGDLLFDEKVSGSIHLAFGSCFPVANNGNESSTHIDIVKMMESEYGGGEVYFDDVLIMKNGKFVHQDVLDLNREQLIKNGV